MGSERYKADIVAGCARSSGGLWTLRQWPPEVPGLGAMRGGMPLRGCIACAPERSAEFKATFVRYGGHPLCCPHAVALAGGADIPFVRDALERARRVVERGLESGA